MVGMARTDRRWWLDWKAHHKLGRISGVGRRVTWWTQTLSGRADSRNGQDTVRWWAEGLIVGQVVG